MTDRPRRRVVITGGGTAGHTNPGIAIGQALVARGLDPDDVHFVGGVRGNESTLVPAAGFSIDLLPGRGIRRELSVDNVGAVLGLLIGLVRAVTMVVRRRPAAVVCLGGYAAFAMSAAAVLARVPLIVSEQNARASDVNRLFGRWARVCALPFPDTDLPNGELTGNPIRSEVAEAVAGADRAGSRAALADRLDLDRVDVDRRTIVAVWAGSLGATSINTAVSDLVERWADRADLVVYHVVGRRDWSHFDQGPPRLDPDRLCYVTVEYEDRMPELLVAADVAVCRSGASTVSELAVAGLPAVLIPLPRAPRDHQTANSNELEQAGGAVVLADDDLSADTLASTLEPMLAAARADGGRPAAMSVAASSVARPSAADAVAGLVLDHADLGRPRSLPTGKEDQP